MKSVPILRSLLAASLGLLVFSTAEARLGETLEQLKVRYGKPEQQQKPRKDQAVWLFEAEDGQLMFNVTFDGHGHSIAEGLRPIKRANFTKDIAEDFIQLQIAPYRNSKTIHTFKSGEKYRFAGQIFTSGEQEVAVVDDANGIMIIWAQSGVPSVMAVTASMVQQTH